MLSLASMRQCTVQDNVENPSVALYHEYLSTMWIPPARWTLGHYHLCNKHLGWIHPFKLKRWTQQNTSTCCALLALTRHSDRISPGTPLHVIELCRKQKVFKKAGKRFGHFLDSQMLFLLLWANHSDECQVLDGCLRILHFSGYSWGLIPSWSKTAAV